MLPNLCYYYKLVMFLTVQVTCKHVTMCDGDLSECMIGAQLRVSTEDMPFDLLFFVGMGICLFHVCHGLV